MSAGIALPVLAFLAYLLSISASGERQRLEREGEIAAHIVADDVERDLTTLTAALQALATSQPLQIGDLATFHATASRLAETLGLAVVLFDTTGQQVINTRRAFGETLPMVHPEVRRGIPVLRANRQPYVTDVFVGQLAPEPLYVLMVPVLSAGTEDIRYMLQLSVPASRIRAILLNTVRPDQGVALIADRKNITLARNRLNEQFEGKEAEILSGAAPAAAGKSRSVTAEGTPVTLFTAPILPAGWTVAVGIEEEALDRPGRELLTVLVGTGAVLLLLSAALAASVGVRITRSLDALVGSAAALGEGQALAPVRTTIREVNAVGEAHASAAGQLREALQSKEVLLYEVNHRVKNSLAVVMSLLALQARQTADPDVKRTLAETRARIAVVAAVHQRLYSTGRHDQVEVGTFLAEIARDTLGGLGGESSITLHLDCDTGIDLPTNTATPLAIIVSELLTNAVKYAFPGGRPGQVSLSVHQRGGEGVLVVVADDGQGLPEGFSPDHSSGLGMRIVTALCRQLRAEFTAGSGEPGARFSISLPREG